MLVPCKGVWDWVWFLVTRYALGGITIDSQYMHMVAKGHFPSILDMLGTGLLIKWLQHVLKCWFTSPLHMLQGQCMWNIPWTGAPTHFQRHNSSFVKLTLDLWCPLLGMLNSWHMCIKLMLCP